jgi:hypothetical protein
MRILLLYPSHNVPFILIYNFAWALGVALASNPVSLAEFCSDEFSIALILQLSRHRHPKIRRKAMLVLAGLCQDPTGRNYVRLNQGIEWILECLQHPDLHVKANALMAAAHICEDSESQKVMFSLGFIPAVLQLLHDSEDTLCASVGKVMCAVTYQNHSNAMTALNLDVVSQVCAAILRRHSQASIAEHLSSLLANLRVLQPARFEVELKKSGGVRALLHLINDDQVDVVARVSPILADISRGSMKKDVFEADGVVTLSQALRWVVSSKSQAVSIVKDLMHILTAVVPVSPQQALKSFVQAKGFVMTSAVLSQKNMSAAVGPEVLELLRACVDRSPDVVSPFQDAVFEHQGLPSLLDFCFHQDDAVRGDALHVLFAACKDNERNKGALREHQAISMLTSIITTQSHPFDIRRTAFRVALEIGFICPSAPFWQQIESVLQSRELARVSEVSHGVLPSSVAIAAAATPRRERDEELQELRYANEKLLAEKQSTNALLTAKDKEQAVLQQAHADLAQQLQIGQAQSAALQDHIRTLQEQVVALQQQLDEQKRNEPTVQEMRDMMAAVSEFMAVKPGASKRK